MKKKCERFKNPEALRPWLSEALAPLRRRKKPELAMGVDLKEATSAQGRKSSVPAQARPTAGRWRSLR